MLINDKTLYDMITKVCSNRKVFYVSGETDMILREIGKIVEESENAIIVASYGTFSTGTKYKKITVQLLSREK